MSCSRPLIMRIKFSSSPLIGRKLSIKRFSIVFFLKLKSSSSSKSSLIGIMSTSSSFKFLSTKSFDCILKLKKYFIKRFFHINLKSKQIYNTSDIFIEIKQSLSKCSRICFLYFKSNLYLSLSCWLSYCFSFKS